MPSPSKDFQQRRTPLPLRAAGVAGWTVLLLLTVPGAASFAATLHGQVVSVADGDTLTVVDGRHRRIKVRLAGIDAPEKDQPDGRQSRAHLKSLALGKMVDVEWDKRDTYGRVIGRVLLAPASCPSCDRSHDAGLAQLGAGHAWWYRSQSRELSPAQKSRYALAENSARARHSGLWAAPEPVAPWQWRHGQGGRASQVIAKTSERIRKVGRVIRHPMRSARRWLRS